MKKFLIILTIIILMISIVGVIEDANIVIRARTVGIDENESKEITIIDISTNKLGQLKYIEWYYSKNETGQYNRDVRIEYYNETVNNNVIILKIKRPLAPDRKPYNKIKALVFIDDKLALDSFLAYEKLTIKEGNTTKEEKKSPGFGIIASILSISLIIFVLKKKNKN